MSDPEYRNLVQTLTTLLTDLDKRLFYLSMAFPNDPQKYSFVVLDSAPATFTGNLIREFYGNRPADLLTLLQVIQEQEGGAPARALQPSVEKLRLCLAPEEPLYKLFISYRRKSWDFTHRLVADLRGRISADIFVDFNSIDSSDFERSILFHLRQADCVLVLVSEHTFSERIHDEGDWMRKEIAEALRLGKPTVLLAHEGRYPPPADQLPPDIGAIAGRQGIEFYPRYWDAAVKELVAFIPQAIRNPPTPVVPSPPAPLPKERGEKTPVGTRPASSAPTPNYGAIFDQATRLYNDEQYAEALPLLKQLAAANYRSRVVAVMLAKAERYEEIQAEYDELADYLRLKSIPAAAYQEWEAFQNNYPDWFDLVGDPQKLRERLRRPRKRSVELLPAPFAWIEIPGGKGTLKTDAPGVTLAVPSEKYWIAKYPLTNAQFAPFMEAGGYTQDRWWTKAGIEARTRENWTEPRLWQDAKWNGAEQPVVGVSWFEAIAYCQWLSEVTGEKIMLPTEAQWQYAAQGTDGREYPWGKNWDTSRCNNNVGGKGIGKTSPVRQYEGKGDSPFGVVDMAGNVWEWCLTDYDQKINDINSNADRRVLRGSGWFNSVAVNFHCVCRSGDVPEFRDVSWGFRLSLS
ncbi:MAG: SUMF1/EgtB/PvdO family nonheme iron enzyme [Anaerolinea sp.]|nr:SUMF1/EgtB/PvdO family nonheme iron enzyme [Anaerolinea sp.]